MTTELTVKRRTSVIDRRNFGRRQTVWHAWYQVSGRPREACLVRNISSGGALLECDVPVWLQYGVDIRLMVDAYDIDIDCEVRHRGVHGLGVQFKTLLEHDAVLSPDRPNTAALPNSGKPGASAVRRK